MCPDPCGALRLGLGSIILLAGLLAGHSSAQDAGTDVTYTKQTLFRIPFQTDTGGQRIKQVYLYMSTDMGKNWHPHSNVPPQSGAFMFNAPKDGLYWFTVRTVDEDNRAFPLTMDGARPGLKVIVDTMPPAITLRQLAPRDGMTGVEWDIQEDNPDFTTFALEYRMPTAAEWMPLRPDAAGLTGNYYWKAGAAGPLEVRLFLKDRAGNEGTGRATVQAAAENRLVSENPGNSAVPPGTAVRMVNSKRFTLNYEVTEQGKSGISAVELWMTMDGRRWDKHSEQKRSEGVEVRPPYEVTVEKEGLYGFTLIVRSGVGLSVQPPQAGDPPQVWVEVDLTRPVVHISKVEVGRGPEAGSLTIHWTATDKNLGRQPITLSFAERPDGHWSTIATNRENIGRYVWRMPTDVPYQFYLRVEAVDRAGNVGMAETSKPVNIDLVLPKVNITDIAPKARD
jgi:hypothetical protein